MRGFFFKYVFEFVVIVFGISVSFQFDQYYQEVQKRDLKNQSLNRILKNIEIDREDQLLNIKIHQIGINSIDYISSNFNNQKVSRVKFGKELSNSIFTNTIFVDNQEEYRSLQNSGLIEKIENDSLVFNLQRKYSSHSFYKQLEQRMYDFADDRLTNFYYNNTEDVDSIESTIYFINNGRVFRGKLPLDRYYVEVLKDKKMFHQFYISSIKSLISRDSILIEQIKKEIELK